MLIFRKNRSIYHLIWSIVFKNDILLRHHNEKQIFFHGSILKSARRDWYKLYRIPKHIDYTIIPDALGAILHVYNILVSVFPKHHTRLYPWVTVVLRLNLHVRKTKQKLITFKNVINHVMLVFIRSYKYQWRIIGDHCPDTPIKCLHTFINGTES